VDGETEEVSLADYDPHRYENRSQGGGAREAYHADEESDEEEMAGHMGGHGQHVQCAQQ
jgi:hypothetical protein